MAPSRLPRPFHSLESSGRTRVKLYQTRSSPEHRGSSSFPWGSVPSRAPALGMLKFPSFLSKESGRETPWEGVGERKGTFPFWNRARLRSLKGQWQVLNIKIIPPPSLLLLLLWLPLSILLFSLDERMDGDSTSREIVDFWHCRKATPKHFLTAPHYISHSF